MKFLFCIRETLATKNKLEAAVKDFILKHDRTLIDQSDRIKFQNKLIAGVERLNEQFPRCKPVELKFWQSAIKFEKLQDEDWSTYNPNFIRAHLIASNDEEKQ